MCARELLFSSSQNEDEFISMIGMYNYDSLKKAIDSDNQRLNSDASRDTTTTWRSEEIGRAIGDVPAQYCKEAQDAEQAPESMPELRML